MTLKFKAKLENVVAIKVKCPKRAIRVREDIRDGEFRTKVEMEEAMRIKTKRSGPG